ncbi:MAG: aminoacyl-tRNA hydrolase [bacterium]|nr:aminoacyl-tRNA hydrolase [bacterium]
MIEITPDISIDESEIEEDFVRSSGPGGQNVNKVSTAVQLRFNVDNSSLPHDIKERLKKLAGKRLSKENVVIIDARRFRTRERNRQDALDRLIALIQKALIVPRTRRKTRPSAATKQKRLDEKHKKSDLKKDRRFKPDSDS